MKQISALKRGDTIGIAASSSPFDRKLFMKGVHTLEKLGFKTFYRHDIFDQNRYLAGTDRRRAEEFAELFANRDVRAIMFARGGYGSQRIIPLLDAAALERNPKPVIGFSDITALLTFLRQRIHIPTFYGPVITLLGKSESSTGEYLLRALTTTGAPGTIGIHGAKTLKPGRASGTLTGGCLTLINSSMGTPYELETDGSILFIEDIGEKIYALDRMLTQLKNSGKFSNVKGFVFGSIIPPADEPYDVKSMIMDVLSDFVGPIVCDFPAGHTDIFVTLPLGANVDLVAAPDGPPALTFTTGLLS